MIRRFGRLAMLALPLWAWVAGAGVSGVARAASFDAAPVYDGTLVRNVVATGLAFMQPRTIEPVPMAQLSVWGLRGLTAIDPNLQLTVDPQAVHLSVLTPEGSRPVWDGAAAAIGPSDAQAWGALVADGLHGGWNASDRVRRLGTAGVVQGFFDELCSHLDPYSRYSPPEEAAAARRERDGAGELGLRIEARPTGLRIVAVDPDGAAAHAGLRRGELIVAIDDTPISADADTETASGLLTGPDDSTVTLRVRDTSTGPGRTLTLRRVGRIDPTVFPRRAGSLLIVRITAFSRDTAARLTEALARGIAVRRPVRGVLLDLRGNRGGLLDQAVAAAGDLLDQGAVATTIGRDPASVRALEVDGGHDATRGLPLVLLVDGRTASSAEVLAAALSDQKRGVVIGTATFGKGLVQTVAPLPDGGELYVSWSQLIAPAGWPLQGLGLLPALCTGNGRNAALAAISELSRGVQPDAGALARHDAARAPLTREAALDIRATCAPADGGDDDVLAATRLIEDSKAYATALKP